ncbi:MAG: ribonuclease D [Methylocystis sp.]|jgi:ribonuclease D|nr:ribonuclease D [Methylocystis sp.]MCA3584481.1 ribonuclease D [Methylocystis sp.]MCA3588022.1 ribonuclease D [Methylocystis sp.]MCA3590497.1 ribonuclease D [Methylocystis sp.]
MSLITTTEDLAALCSRLATHPYVTVDTEFMRETTFWPKLCVIQLASEEEAAAIDALADGIDLSPFIALMNNEAVLKVFHAARQDIEIIWKMSGTTPKPLFDTQVAAMVCGFGDQVSYEQLAASLANARIDKSSRFTDWSRRPLTEAQITYALADVTHLRVIYTKLAAKLSKTERTAWLTEEISFLTAVETYEQKPENAWLRLRARARKPRDLAILMQLAAWREEEAQARDVPRSRVLKDDTLVDIALSAPDSIEALGRLRTIPQGYERSKTGQDVVSCVQRVLHRDASTYPKPDRDKPASGAASAVVQLLKVLLQSISERHQVAAKMIATVDELEMIAGDGNADTPALKGWRYELFGQQALELKAGRLALSVENGRIVTRAATAAD